MHGAEDGGRVMRMEMGGLREAEGTSVLAQTHLTALTHGAHCL